MEQYIKIKAMDDENNHLGTFTVSIEFNFTTKSTRSIVDFNKEIKLDSTLYNIPSNSTITLYNVPIVYEFDNKTPIQYLKTSENNVNIMLLEEFRYTLSFRPGKDFDKELYDVFHSLLKFDSEVLELFPKTYNGFLSLGSYVGKSFLDIYKGKKSIFKIPFEVRSRKIDYATQYAAMIGDLSKFSQSLIYDSSSPLHQQFELDDIKDKASYEEFMLLEYLFKDENLPSTIEYLSRNLYSALENTIEEVPTSFASNVNPNDLIDVFSNPENLYETKDENSIFAKRTNSYVPLKVNETRYVDNIDVPENRFHKNFLELIESLIIELLKKSPQGYIKDKLLIYKEQISAYLSQRYFKDISRMDYVPLNSQLLQKKEGYRDILEYYLMFEFGFRLNWDEVTTEFMGNEKKLFELYEYWCYFELVSILSELTSSIVKFKNIFDIENLSISLKHNLISTFYFDADGKKIKLDLAYNRSFYKTNKEFKTYSVKLRPDYSLIVNIPIMNEYGYSNHKKYVIHFDAKYKLDIDSETFKNEDIVKMHAYKDAIVGTIGAYVIYPGEKKKIYRKSNKLESVGAFPLSPGDDKSNKKELADFIYDFILDLINLN